MERNWEKQVMEILIDYDYRYSVASLSILMEKIRPVISQALTNQATEIGKEMEKEITGEMYVGGGLVRLDVVLSIINKYKGTHD